MKVKVSITIDYDILDKVRENAEKEDRALSQYINLVLRDHIKRDLSQKKRIIGNGVREN